MTKIKLCGLTRRADIEAANELQPDYIGFVFAAGSRRRIAAEEAMALKRLLRPEVKAVGVFVNENPETIRTLAEKVPLDGVQLHGAEDNEYIERLAGLIRVPILQAFTVKSRRDLAGAGGSRADFVLLDSGAGTGTPFDWSLIESLKRPYFLAGGLTPQNVPAAIRRLRPYAVDTSSGIEAMGKKDPEKMADFVAAVRNPS